MKVSFLLKGIRDPATVAEMSGTTYFRQNFHASDDYYLESVAFEAGRLCLYFGHEQLPKRLNVSDPHYVKVKPGWSEVELVIEEYKLIDDCNGTVHAVFYLVDSMYDSKRGHFFRFYKYEKDLDGSYCENIDHYHLIMDGFVCTEDLVDDGEGTYIIYRKKE